MYETVLWHNIVGGDEVPSKACLEQVLMMVQQVEELEALGGRLGHRVSEHPVLVLSLYAILIAACAVALKHFGLPGSILIFPAVHAERDFAELQNAKLEVEISRDPLPARINPIEIEQVIVNLIHNALEAIEAKTAGGRSAHVKVHCYRIGDSLYVEDLDEGRGIGDEDLKHIFDPFFTTRLSEGGTGLGLSVAHGIAMDHGGRLNVESKLGEGSRFILELPADVSIE